MDKWRFLAPWATEVAAMVVSFERRNVRAFSIRPTTLWLDLPRDRHATIARAMELVALAIRVDPLVVTLVSYDPACIEDLQLTCQWTQHVTPADAQFFQPTQDDDGDGPLSAAAYVVAKAQIHALDKYNRLAGYVIPLTLCLRGCNVGEATAMFQCLLATETVAGGPQDQNVELRAVYRLTDVWIEHNGKRQRTWMDLDRAGLPALPLGRRLDDLGVPITLVRAAGEDIEDVSQWMARGRPLQLLLSVKTDAVLARVVDACTNLGDRLDALTLVLDPQRLDAEVVAHAMQRLPSEVVTHLASWLPSLNALTLGGGGYLYEPYSVDDASIALILRSFPHLRTLDLTHMGNKSWDCVLDAYRDGACRVRSLSINGDACTVTPLLRALADPAQRIAQTLEELKVRCVHQHDEDLVLAATKAMLEANRVLDYVVIYVTRSRGSDNALDRFCHKVIVKPEAVAFLSVAHVHRLDRDVSRRVFDFVRVQRQRFAQLNGSYR